MVSQRGMLQGFSRDGRNPLSPEAHLTILKNNDHIVIAIDPETGKVVGFVTALPDGVQAAFIPLLEVLPEYRGR